MSNMELLKWLKREDEDEYYEVRPIGVKLPNQRKATIPYYKERRDLANKLGLPFLGGSIFVKYHHQLDEIVRTTRDWGTIFMSINPRVPAPYKNKHGKESITCSGKRISVPYVKHILIDVDRVEKNGPATQEDMDKVSMIIDKFLLTMQTPKYIKELNGEERVYAKEYVRINSGNGEQILLKLNNPIKIDTNEAYEDYKDGVLSFYKMAQRFVKELSDEFEIDMCVRDPTRVFSLPETFNFKYGGKVERKLIAIKYGDNDDIGEYILGGDKTEVRRRRILRHTEPIQNDTNPFKVTKGKVKDNGLIKAFTTQSFNKGQRHTTIWFMIRILLRDAGLNENDNEVQEVLDKVNELHGYHPFDSPAENFIFEPFIALKSMIESRVLFDFDLKKYFKEKFKYKCIKYIGLIYAEKPYEFKSTGGLFTEMMEAKETILKKKRLGYDDNNLTKLINSFLTAWKGRYGEQLIENYLKYNVIQMILTNDCSAKNLKIIDKEEK